jgi:preprotein translocase subunit SecD
VFCVGSLLPTFADDYVPPWYDTLFEEKITLGLDIQGGARFVYSIDLDKAVDDKANEIKRDVEAFLADHSIKGKVTTPGDAPGALNVRLEDATKKAEVAKHVKTHPVVDRACADQVDKSICVRVSTTYADNTRRLALKQAVDTVRNRIDARGVAENNVQEKGDDIIVELPGLDEDQINRIRDVISRTAKLEFKVVDNTDKNGQPGGSQYMQVLFGHVAGDTRPGREVPADPEAIGLDIKAEVDGWTPDNGPKQTDYFLRASDREESIPLAEAKELGCLNREKEKEAVGGKVWCKLTGRYVIARYIDRLAAKDERFKVPEDRQLGYEYVDSNLAEGDKPYWRSYYLDRATRLTGSSVLEAYGSFDQQTNQPIVLVTFNRHGGRVFGELTSANVGKKIATILDDRVKSAPVINQAIRGGSASITLGGSNPEVQMRERDDLVGVLKTGSLPAPLRLEAQSQVGPLLGRDAVDKAQFAFLLGGILVVLLMGYVYRISGMLALVTLSLNVLFVLCTMAVLGATLTLPGIAGIVLTFGMSVDGNIIIFERIREELQTGKSIRGAVDTGFQRAFAAIFDGQLTTMAGGFVLMQYGTGPIYGFAVTLIIGNVTALFANIWCTRVLYDHYLNRIRASEKPISI